MPLTSTEPCNEKPDCLHLDINITKHLITVASRLYHNGRTGQPIVYAKSEADRKELESSEAKYHEILRGHITTLPEFSQNPVNFARKFNDEKNAEHILKPLPDIPDTHIWKDLMILWRRMRAIHKSNRDPSSENISSYKESVINFQEKLSSLKWVPLANQIHRLCHVAYFMENSAIRSVGAFSLEGKGVTLVFGFLSWKNRHFTLNILHKFRS